MERSEEAKSGPGPVEENLRRVRAKIADACGRCGRDPAQVKLLAVTKGVPAETVLAAIRAGQKLFGANYVQEAQKKYASLIAQFGPDKFQAMGAVFHFIGSLQRNKAKTAAGFFKIIQTVDRLPLAQELAKAAAAKGIVQEVLVQVNISHEQSKSGAEPDQTAGLCREICALSALKLSGLMIIGSYDNADISRQEFREVRRLRDDVQERLSRPLPELSMGMSHDYEAAIEEGATIIRVGRAIFGEREKRAEDKNEGNC